jgi:hypothetical protein
MNELANESAKKMLDALVGRSLWDSTRAADMEMFQFGARVPRLSFRGEPQIVGEFALHLSGSWRIVSGDRVFAGYRDLWSPRTGVPEEGFNWSKVHKKSSRRDELMEQFLLHGEPAHVVEAAGMSPVGDLHLAFADGCICDAFADIGFTEMEGDEAPYECWRLFSPSTDTWHLVVEAGGVVDDRPADEPLPPQALS